MKRICIGIDSFDTPLAGCTTHFTSLLLRRLQDIHGVAVEDALLVRLNPSIPWKTRGNGATAIGLKTGSESLHTVLSTIEELAEEYRKGGGGKASLIITTCDRLNPCVYKVYRRGLSTIILDDHVAECIERLDVLLVVGEKNIGLKGAIAALAPLHYGLTDYTFELITYRHPDHWLVPRVIDERSVVRYDLLFKPLTFLNYDYANRKILVTPHGYDPVLYGVRGERRDIVAKSLYIVKTSEKPTHHTIFLTNQATNAHLVFKKLEQIKPYDSVITEGRIEGFTIIEKGHILFTLCDNDYCVKTAAYRETGRMRKKLAVLAKHLESARVRVAGTVKQHRGELTINAEYIDIPLNRVIGTIHYAGFDNEVKVGKYVRLLPDSSAYHHLMKPLERYMLIGLH